MRFVVTALLSLAMCAMGFALFREAAGVRREGSGPSRNPIQWLAFGVGAAITTIVILSFRDEVDPLIAPVGALVCGLILILIVRKNRQPH